MAFEGDRYATRTLDFFERLQRLDQYDDICRHIMKEMEWFGFTCVTSWSMPGPGADPADCLLLNNRPQEYIDRYIEKNYVLRDPVVTELRRTLTPFSWTDLRGRRDLTKYEKAIMNEGRDFGANDGFIVPIVTLSGSMAAFSPCGLEPDLSGRARAAIEIIGIYSYLALTRTLNKHPPTEAAHTPLTPREREIMHWVATGKTDDEIAKSLSLSTRTVTWHVENAKCKLNAFRRTYAVAQAIRFGEISL